MSTTRTHNTRWNFNRFYFLAVPNCMAIVFEYVLTSHTHKHALYMHLNLYKEHLYFNELVFNYCPTMVPWQTFLMQEWQTKVVKSRNNLREKSFPLVSMVHCKHIHIHSISSQIFCKQVYKLYITCVVVYFDAEAFSLQRQSRCTHPLLVCLFNT